ncbi:MAG: hypothetical protein ACRETE_02150 [Stenotrophobium sp.]
MKLGSIAPLLKEDVLTIVDALPVTARGTRDRALLLVGFAAALRRSELVGLNVEDVKFVTEGRDGLGRETVGCDMDRGARLMDGL